MLYAPVVDGKIQDTSASSDSLSSTGKNSNSSLDKDAFLQLLVAQMKYQDPLEPTSNTEYISQFATFSELEEMQNMRQGMDIQRAQALVGQNVIMKTTNKTTGATNYVTGRVDYVTVENGKAFLNIDEAKYSLDDLDTVVDQTYKDAFDKASQFVDGLSKLPAIGVLTTESMDTVFELKETYDSMNEYEKGFISKDVVEVLDKYVAKMEELMKAEGLTYTKEEAPTTEDLLQDLLDKIDQILSDVGDISGNVSGKDDEDTNPPEDNNQGGSADNTDGNAGNTDGNAGNTDGVGGTGGTDDTGETGGADNTGGSTDSADGSADNTDGSADSTDGAESTEGGGDTEGGT